MPTVRIARAAAALALALLAACGGGTSQAASASSEPAPAPRAAAPADPGKPLEAAARKAKGLPDQLARSSDPHVLAATLALEAQDLATATRELLAADDGLDAELLRARRDAAEGDEVSAVRRIEALRARFADQARLYATAAEIHAAAGRLASAEEEIRAGLATCGPTPELSRARGVLALSRSGGARVGLNDLLDARAADPDLPFLARPLYEAHLLLGRQAMADSKLADAIGHARAALLALPKEHEARLLLADALCAAGDFDEALALYEGLLADGAPVRDTLASACKQAATAALVEGRRDVAIERNLRARALGLADSDLGFGATLLSEESARVVGEGIDAFEAGDLDKAGERFERALVLDPGSLAARNHLGVVDFRRGDHAGAAAQWRQVLDAARAQKLELPDPVQLNLARALYLDGKTDEVRALLKDELARDPAGRWSEAERDLLARLDEEAAAPADAGSPPDEPPVQGATPAPSDPGGTGGGR